ncbi:MAG: hypothetical protein AB8B82_05590 [Roseovarius sp.]
MKHIIALLSITFATPALAQECPAAPDHKEALSLLITATQEAETELDARIISQDMWALWTKAPDTRAQELLDEGMSRREGVDYDGALTALEELVRYCPDYAEGYNQRAFVNFLRQDYAGALPDLERASELSPRHLGVLTGQAMTLIALDRNAEAALVLRRALALNPWLGERHLLPALEAEENEL